MLFFFLLSQTDPEVTAITGPQTSVVELKPEPEPSFFTRAGAVKRGGSDSRSSSDLYLKKRNKRNFEKS